MDMEKALWGKLQKLQNAFASREVTNKLVCPLEFSRDPDFSFAGFDFYWQSEITPSKNDLQSVTAIFSADDGSSANLTLAEIPMGSDAFCTRQLINALETPLALYVSFVYRVGETTVDLGDGTPPSTIYIPKAGVYTVGYPSNLGLALTLTWNSKVETLDPKFLPNVVIDGSSVGPLYAEMLTTGKSSLKSTEYVLPEEAWDKIPMDGRSCTLTVGLGDAILIDTAPRICVQDGHPVQLSSQVVTYMGGFGICVFNSIFFREETMVTLEIIPKPTA